MPLTIRRHSFALHVLEPWEPLPSNDFGSPGDLCWCWPTTLIGPKGPAVDGNLRGIWPNAITIGASVAGLAPWSADHTYSGGDVVISSGALYVATSAHTSTSDFNADIGSGLWFELSSASGGRVETVDPLLCSSTASPAATGLLYLFRVSGSGPISNINIEVANQAGNINVVAYANNGQQGTAAAPAGSPLSQSGPVACPPAAAGTLTPIALQSAIGVADGDWFGIAFDTATAAVRSTPIVNGTGTTWQGRAGWCEVTDLGTLGAPNSPTLTWGSPAGFLLVGS